MRDFMEEDLRLLGKSSHYEPLLIIFFEKKNACSLCVHDFTVYDNTYCRSLTVKLLLDPIV